MANSRTLVYDSLVTTTLDNLHKGGSITNLVHNSNPTFATLKAKARTSVSGGHQVRVPIANADVNNVNSMNQWGDIDLTPQEGLTTLFDNWAIYSGAVTITGHEERTNRGKEAIISLVKEKVNLLVNGFAERMNKDLWYLGVSTTDATGNGDLNIKSIPIIVSTVSGATSGRDIDYLGIDRSANTYWQPQIFDFTNATVTAQRMINGLRTCWLLCSKKQGGSPDLAICDYTSYAMYQAALDTKVQYTDTKMADMGFANVKLEGATLFPDVYVPDADSSNQSTAAGGTLSSYPGSVYMLNTKTLSLKTLAGADFQPGAYEKIDGKDAKAAPYIWEGQLVCDNPQKNGVAFSLPTVITAG